jgi:putative hemolysin
MAEHPTRFLSAVQVGITLIGIFAGAYGQATIASALDHWLEGFPLVAKYSEGIATTIVVIGLTYVSVILGELVPKRLALMFPDVIARRMAPFLAVVATVLRPFVTLLTVSTAAVLKLMGVRDERSNGITSEEVETVLAEGADAGLIEPEERSMIQEVLRLGDRPVRVAMTPRRDLFWVSLADSPESAGRDPRQRPLAHPGGPTATSTATSAWCSRRTCWTPACRGFRSTSRPRPAADRHSRDHVAAQGHGGLQADQPAHGPGGRRVRLAARRDHAAGPAGNDRRRLPGRPRRRREAHHPPRGRRLADRRPPRHPGTERHLGENFEAEGGYHTVAGLILDRLGRLPVEGESSSSAPSTSRSSTWTARGSTR